MQRRLTQEELDALYRGIGKGIWHLQHVEDALHMLITLKVEIKLPGRVTHEESKQLLAKHRRNTLGDSLRIIKAKSLVSPEIETRLRNFKEERNWLVHHSLNTHGELLYTDPGRAEMFERLSRFFTEANALQHDIAKEIAIFAESHGISSAEAEARARNKVAKLMGHDV